MVRGVEPPLLRISGLTNAVQVGRHRGFDVCTAHYDSAAHSEADA